MYIYIYVKDMYVCIYIYIYVYIYIYIHIGSNSFIRDHNSLRGPLDQHLPPPCALSSGFDEPKPVAACDVRCFLQHQNASENLAFPQLCWFTRG